MSLRGDELPSIVGEVPGPASRALVDLLAQHECPAITARRSRRASALGTVQDDPMVWKEAVGACVRDVDGNTYIDLTSGFSVALLGHRHPAVVTAIQRQSDVLLHAMGDAFPDRERVLLLQELAGLTPDGLDVAILGTSGSDAVDAAVKTAVLATGRPGVVTFDGSYHGLALGVLPLQGYRPAFAHPFEAITHPHVHRLPWGCEPEALTRLLARHSIGLVLAEPILGRGGIHPPPTGWLVKIASASREAGALFALDEIQTGLGRTGSWWAGTTEGVVPDLMCVGKALGGGVPLSACLGTRAVMDAWGASDGEAIHTQTFLGNPLACAAARASLAALTEVHAPERCEERGLMLQSALVPLGLPLRGRGLMRAVELPADGLAVSRALQQRGILALPAGPTSLGLLPPLCITDRQIDHVVNALGQVLSDLM